MCYEAREDCVLGGVGHCNEVNARVVFVGLRGLVCGPRVVVGVDDLTIQMTGYYEKVWWHALAHVVVTDPQVT